MDTQQLKEKIRQYICTELLNNPAYPLRDDEPLITSGLMDSFSLAQIGVFAEIEFNTYVPDVDLTVDKMNTVDQIVSQIKEKMR